MTEQPPEGEDPRIGAAEEERVRRALAATGPEGLPDDVAAHLDDTLAALVAERRDQRPAGTPQKASAAPTPAAPATAAPATGGPPAGVARLDPQRRAPRRRWPTVLVAAAALCLIALGAGDLVRSGGSGGAANSNSQAASEAQAGAGTGTADAAAPLTGEPPLPRLHSATLGTDAARVAWRPPATRALAPGAPGVVRCVAPPHGRSDRVVLVRFDGRPAGLVLATTAGGLRVARVYPCARPGRPLASARLPAH